MRTIAWKDVNLDKRDIYSYYEVLGRDKFKAIVQRIYVVDPKWDQEEEPLWKRTDKVGQWVLRNRLMNSNVDDFVITEVK